jgi:3-methylcrotonyl-CoA carboxylase alpha subunit
MIAKLIVYGENRETAIERLQAALKHTVVFGVKTNAELLLKIATHPAFQEGFTFTSFLEDYGIIGAASSAQDKIRIEQETSENEILHNALLAAALFDMTRTRDDLFFRNGQSPANPWQILGPWRMIGEARSVSYTYQEEKHRVAIFPAQDETGAWNVQVDAQPVEKISCVFGNNDLVLLRRGAKQLRVYVRQLEGDTHVIFDGQYYRFERRQPPDVDSAAHSRNVAHLQKALTAPMAGTIVKVQVHDGETVEHRQVLVILSAMKMEHTIIAPYEGKVRRVLYHEGEVVKGGAIIVEME